MHLYMVDAGVALQGLRGLARVGRLGQLHDGESELLVALPRNAADRPSSPPYPGIRKCRPMHKDSCKLLTMTPEMCTIIGVGIALAALITYRQLGLNSEISTLATRVQAIEEGQAGLRERMTHLEGLLEGLLTAITCHRAA